MLISHHRGPAIHTTGQETDISMQPRDGILMPIWHIEKGTTVVRVVGFTQSKARLSGQSRCPAGRQTDARKRWS